MNLSTKQQKNQNIGLQSHRSNNTMYSIQQQLLKSPQSFQISQQNHHNINQFVNKSNESNIKDSKIKQKDKEQKQYKQWNQIQYGNNITKLMKQNQNINRKIKSINQIKNNNVNVNIQYKNIINSNNNKPQVNNSIINNNNKQQVNNSINNNIIYITKNNRNNDINTNPNPSSTKPQRLYTFHPNFRVIRNNKIQTIASKPIQNNNLNINHYERYRDSQYSNNDQKTETNNNINYQQTNNNNLSNRNKNKISNENSPYKQLYDENSFNTVTNNNNTLSNVNLSNINNNSIKYNINNMNSIIPLKKQPRIFRSLSQSIKSQQPYQSKLNNNINQSHAGKFDHKNNQFDKKCIEENHRFQEKQQFEQEQLINLNNKMSFNGNNVYNNKNTIKYSTRRIPFNPQRKLSYEQSIQYSKQDKQMPLKYSKISQNNNLHHQNNMNNNPIINNPLNSQNTTNRHSNIKVISTSLVYTPTATPHYLSQQFSHTKPTHYQFYSPQYSQYYPKQQNFSQFNLFINQDNRKHSSISMEFIDDVKLKKKQCTLNEKINQMEKNRGKNKIEQSEQILTKEKQNKVIKNINKQQIVYISIIVALVIVTIGIILST